MRMTVPGSFVALLSALLCIASAGIAEAASLSSESVRGSRIRDLIKDVDRNCIPIVDAVHLPDLAPRSRAQLNLGEALETIQKSELGAWLLQVAADQRVLLCLDHTTDLEAHYRFHLQLIGLSARLSPASRIVFLAHELAHIPQHPKFSNNRLFSPKDMLLLQRLREAAAEAIATRVLWQLRDHGILSPWQAKLKTAYRDIATAFEKGMVERPNNDEKEMAERSNNDHELAATRTAFHQWFNASWRLEIYDNLMMKTLSRIATNSTGEAPNSLHLSKEFLVGIDDYADQRFLRDGDSHLLIQKFHILDSPNQFSGRPGEVTARMEKSTQKAIPSSSEDDALSAISPIFQQDREN
jgi:hypothetical protein